MRDLQSLRWLLEGDYLAGYQGGVAYIHGIAGIVNERPTRFARGKGEVKREILAELRGCRVNQVADRTSGYIDALLVSVN